jgi:hypothetical protein
MDELDSKVTSAGLAGAARRPDPALLAVLRRSLRIGNARAQRPSAGVFCLLNAVGSNLLLHPEQEQTVQDVAVAAFVMAKGKAACESILGLAEREQALRRLEPLAASSEIVARVLVERTDELAKVRAKFHAEAMDFWIANGVTDLQQAVDTMVFALFEFCYVQQEIEATESRKDGEPQALPFSGLWLASWVQFGVECGYDVDAVMWGVPLAEIAAMIVAKYANVGRIKISSGFDKESAMQALEAEVNKCQRNG